MIIAPYDLLNSSIIQTERRYTFVTKNTMNELVFLLISSRTAGLFQFCPPSYVYILQLKILVTECSRHYDFATKSFENNAFLTLRNPLYGPLFNYGKPTIQFDNIIWCSCILKHIYFSLLFITAISWQCYRIPTCKLSVLYDET